MSTEPASASLSPKKATESQLGPQAAPRLERSIGVSGAVYTIIGYIIGGSIFILPGELAASAGPGVFLAYLVAGTVALFACLVAAQIGSVFPVTGANYVAVSTVLSPFWGFLLVWMVLLAISIGVPPLCFGFADYLAVFIPAVAEHRLLTAIAILLLFVAVNLMGIVFSVRVQGAMVVVFMAVLLAFGLGGVASLDPRNLSPFLPNGFEAALRASIPAYYSYAGFFVIVSLGGEVKKPQRTIPLSLAISFLAILVTYQTVTLAVPGLIPWQELGGTQAALARASELFLPQGMASVIVFGALLAIATSINGNVLAKSRDLFALARDRILPAPLARVHARHNSPNGAILFLGSAILLGVLLQRSFAEYASMAVICLMGGQILAGIAAFKMAQALPDHYTRARFKLGAFWRAFWCLGLVALSAFFIVYGVAGSLRSVLLFLAAAGLGSAYYFLRRWQLRRRGYRIEDLLVRDIQPLLEDSE